MIADDLHSHTGDISQLNSVINSVRDIWCIFAYAGPAGFPVVKLTFKGHQWCQCWKDYILLLTAFYFNCSLNPI